MEEKRELRRRPDNHHFGSLLMLAATAGVFLLITWVGTKALIFFLQETPIRLSSFCRRSTQKAQRESSGALAS